VRSSCCRFAPARLAAPPAAARLLDTSRL
jgi:hypothetical protein